MARPKGSTKAAAAASSSDDKEQLTISHKDFMEYQNKLSSILNTYHSMASTYAGAAASFMNAVSASMRIVQHYTRHWPHENGMEDVKFDGYPDLEKMMAVDGGPSFDAFAHAPVLRQSLSEAPVAAVAAGIPTTITAPPAVITKVIDAKDKKKTKKPKDPNAPKRPVTAYFVYLEERREPIAKELGPSSKPGDVQAKATEEWNGLSDEAKESYRERYRVKLEQYKKDMDAYKKKKAEAGEPVEDDAGEGASTLLATTVLSPEADELKAASPVTKKRGPAKGKGKGAVKVDEEAKETPASKKAAATPEASKKRKSDAADRSAKKRKSEAAEAEAEPKKKGGRKKKGDA